MLNRGINSYSHQVDSEFDTAQRMLIQDSMLRSDSLNFQSFDEIRDKQRAKRIIDSHYKDFSVLGNQINNLWIGFGTYSYFYLMEKLIVLFLILSLIGIFNIALFGYFGENRMPTHILSQMSLGNLGFSTAYWKSATFHIGRLTLV